MRTLLWVVVVLNQVVLVMKSSITFASFDISEFAFRERLQHHSGQRAKLLREAHKSLYLIKTWRWVTLILSGTLSVALLTHLTQPLLGLIYALLGFCLTALVSRLSLLQGLADTLLERWLASVIKLVNVLRPILKPLSIDQQRPVLLPGSKDEFLDQLRRLPSTVVTPIQRLRLESVLEAEKKTVKNIMTLKKRVVIIEPSATLGPVLLADLQKSGHGYFPVATKKGQPEGILTLGDVTDINLAKQRASVRDLMSSHVAWAEEGTSLYELAEAFLEEKQYIILVQNIDGEFSGVVTIADLMKHVIGVTKSEL